ncbi:VP80 [Orgyia pseudotsugata single capsid nuclopolyhedrovirus]|nr:VP80 [Orgyia pseudotsugata single capsid nuclopolyhedrovirus]
MSSTLQFHTRVESAYARPGVPESVVGENNNDSVLFVRVDMVGDGACIFRSLAYVLFDDVELHLTMRAAIVEHITKNWDEYKNFIMSRVTKQAFADKAEYRNYMSQAAVYATFVEINAAAKLFDVCIKIYHADEKRWQPPIGNEQDPVVYLKFSGQIDSGHMDVYESPQLLNAQNFKIKLRVLLYKYLKYLNSNQLYSPEAETSLNRMHELARGEIPFPVQELDIITTSITNLYNENFANKFNYNAVVNVPDTNQKTMSFENNSQRQQLDPQYYSIAQLQLVASHVLTTQCIEKIMNLASVMPMSHIKLQNNADSQLFVYVKFVDLFNQESMRRLFLSLVDFKTTPPLPEQTIALLDDLSNDTSGILERQAPTVKQALVDLLKKQNDTLSYILYLFIEKQEYDNIETGLVKNIFNSYNTHIQIYFRPVASVIKFTLNPFENFNTSQLDNAPSSFAVVAAETPTGVIADDALVDTVSASIPFDELATRKKRKHVKRPARTLSSRNNDNVSSDESNSSERESVVKRKRPHVRLDEITGMFVSDDGEQATPTRSISIAPTPSAASPFDPTAEIVEEPLLRPPNEASFESTRTPLQIPAPQSMPAYLIKIITTIPGNVDDLYLTCPTNALQESPRIHNFTRSFDRVKRLNLSPLNGSIHFFKMLSPLAYYGGDELNESQALWFIAKSHAYFVTCADSYDEVVKPFREYANRDRIFMFMVKYNFLWHYRNFIKTLPVIALTAFANQKLVNTLSMYDKIVQNKYDSLMMVFPASQSTFGVEDRLLNLMINVD